MIRRVMPSCGHDWCAPGDECRRGKGQGGDVALTVASMLNGRPWDADICDAIAETLRLAGYEVRDVG